MLKQSDLYSAIKTWLEAKALLEGNTLVNRIVYTPTFDVDFSFIPRFDYCAAIKSSGYSTDWGKEMRYPEYIFEVAVFVKLIGNYETCTKQLTDRVDYFVSAARDTDYISAGVHLSLLTDVGAVESVVAGADFEDWYAYQIMRFSLKYLETL